ncbi:MAG: MBL fold metallo-hydrolase [Saprospiraceae bacterium]
MKKIYWFLIAIVVITLLVLLFSFINRDRMMDRMIEMAMSKSANKIEYIEDRDGIRVITLGTASPLSSDRNQTGTAIFVDGMFFLFDVGYGVIRQAELEKLPLNKLSGIFLSHWHSDHFIELPYAINRSWQLGRKHPLDIYGPEGLDTVLIGVSQFLKYENENRVSHHGSEVMNPLIAGVNSRTIDMRGSVSTILYQQNELRITAFEVCHQPVTPSYGFRIDYKGKSVVISGDTKEKCHTLEDFAKGTDLLLHEVMLKDVFEKSSKRNAKNGNERNAKIAQDITKYHTSPIDIGIMAQRAGVKKVVLHHFAPVPSNLIFERRYKSDLSKNYKGAISLAEDGNEYYVEIN